MPDCSEPERFRGVCLRHYRRVERMVKAGKLTWDEAERQGMVGPCRNVLRQDFGVGK